MPATYNILIMGASYGSLLATKLLFGGYLDARLLYFRFRNPIWNSILSPLASFFDFERNDPELQKLLQSSKPPVRRG